MNEQQQQDRRCVVWWVHYGSAWFRLATDEDDAVRIAYGVTNSDEGSLLGVQYADGRAVKDDQWEAYQRYQDEQDSAPRPEPAPVARVVGCPFGDGHYGKVEIRADEDLPEWIGVPWDKVTLVEFLRGPTSTA